MRLYLQLDENELSVAEFGDLFRVLIVLNAPDTGTELELFVKQDSPSATALGKLTA